MKQIFFLLTAVIILSCSHATSTSGTTENKSIPINNFLLNTHWLSNPGEGDLEFIPLDTTGRFQYGFHIEFPDSTSYINYYTAPCGNDCFRSIYGKYEFLSDSTIVLTRDSITYDGDCSQPTAYMNTQNQYTLHISEDGKILLKKE